jgi:hypothetical protein
MSPAPPPTWSLRLHLALFVGALTLLGLALLLPHPAVEVAEDEQRRLAPAPELSWSTLESGAFAEAIEAYLADHFPARANFMAAHFWLKERRGRRDPRIALYEPSSSVDDDLPPIEAWAPSAELHEELDHLDPIIDLDVTEGIDDPDDPDEPLDPTSAHKEGGILIVDGRALQLFTGGPRGARAYASILNDYEAALRDRVRVYSIIVPTAQTFYLPQKYAHFSRPEPPNIRATYDLMAPGVLTIDAHAALKPHAREYIYFRTDHHWTALGAYYAYIAFCQAAGLEPIALDAMERRRKDNFRGSLYRLTRDSALGAAPDHVDYWLPPVDVRVTRYTPDMQRVAIQGPLIRERGAGYGVFLGGDFPLIVAKTDVNPGRRALLIKNSYGNPFAVYLAAHFERLLIVDYRYFNGSVLDLIRDHEVTDLIVLNGAITANARFHAARIGWVMDAGKRSRRARRRAAPAP